MMANWNTCLDFDANATGISFSVQDGGIYTNMHGMPFKTAEEFERHYYMKGDTRMASMWTIADDLDTALSVASRLDE